MKPRDLELLSSYLDGQLTPSESARLETRIQSDPQLESALADLRAARSILRKLPKRKAPRNFMLSKKMVHADPPLPRVFSLFQYSSAFATVLLMFSFLNNFITPRISYTASVPLYGAVGMGGGGGGYDNSLPQAASEMAEESSALEISPPAAEDTAREVPAAPMEKSAGAEDSAPQNQPEAGTHFRVSIGWQIALALMGIFSAAVMFALKQSAKRKWQ